MKRLIFAFLLFSEAVVAQRIIIKGQVMAPDEKPLPSATVILLNPTDSSLVNFGATNTDGFFELKNIKYGNYLLKITFVGNKTFSRTISPTPGQLILDLGVVKMEEATTKLDEVIVMAEKTPVQIKGDTIEYNATAFKTKQNDNVEELLKKLPGVEVETDGTVKAQGEEVKKVTVDGREFFGRDPKLATRNLPADAIDKVQVFDKKSDQTEFTGIDDGQREKTINLELKEEKRNGVFGNVTGGIGTDERFTGKLSLNRFKKGQQLSFIGQGNNINDQNFSTADYINFSGGLNSGGGAVRIGGAGGGGISLNTGGRQNGLMTSYAAGLNFSEAFSNKTELATSYFFNYIDHDLDKTTNRISYYPDKSDLYYSEDSRQLNTNANHKINLTLDQKLDSANSFKLTTSITYNDTESTTLTQGENLFEDGTQQNENTISSIGFGESWTVNNNLLLRHKFEKAGRTISGNVIYNLSETNTNGNLEQDITYFKEPADSLIHIEQRNTQKNTNHNYGINLSYTEPLGGRKYLETNYSIRMNDSEVDRAVYDIENSSETFNTLLSNRYSSQYLYQRAGANVKFNHKNYTLTAGASYQFTDLNGLLILSDTEINKTFNNILPAVFFNYNFTSTKRLNINYETSVQEPTIQQLSPVIDNSNALNIYVGNKNLEPSYNHRLMVHYNAFNPVSFVSFFARLNTTYTDNSIVNAQTVDDNYITYTAPINLGSTFNTNANLAFGFPINKISSRINLNANARLSNSISLLNGVESDINNQTVGGNIGYEYRYKEVFDINLRANLSNQVTKYEDESRNQSFLNQTYTAEGNFNFMKFYALNAAFDYMIYAYQGGGTTQKIPFLNLSLSRYVLKAKSGEIKLGVVNVLDQILGVTQTATNNSVERQTMNSLGRYYMISFTYALNKQLNPMSGMGGRGGRMMIIRE
jgi:outer membrane receptor protein involved in Fe transport